MEAAEEAGAGRVDVSAAGVDSGRLTLTVEALGEGRRPSLSGLEGTAGGGAGWGIDPRPSPPPPRRAPAARSQPAAPVAEARTVWRRWRAGDLPRKEAAARRPDGVEEAFGGLISRAYAALQADAGRAVGIPPGAAWRTAMEAAAAVGAQQFHLGDRPTDITRQRLAAGMFSATAPQSIAGVAAFIGTAAIAAAGAVPEGVPPMAAVGVAAAVLGVSLWPILGPLVEVGRFSRMSAASIEEAVRVKTPIKDSREMLKLTGEDAIIDFPGAKRPIIDERDLYMAASIHAAASGSEGVSPSYVLCREADGSATYRYMMPANNLENSCPKGSGDGVFEPIEGVSSVVAVVGTAHVYGIVRNWEKIADKPMESVLTELL
uniref:Uncharacterized protein n=1 Tax=Tetraselmis sp. GSL018 TaxID=582737 RepID=A0A061R0E3_9CHLO